MDKIAVVRPCDFPVFVRLRMAVQQMRKYHTRRLMGQKMKEKIKGDAAMAVMTTRVTYASTGKTFSSIVRAHYKVVQVR